MRLRFIHATVIVAGIVFATEASPKELHTLGHCSPIVQGAGGDVTIIFDGGCTVGITPGELQKIVEGSLKERRISPEFLDKYELLSRQLGVTETALTTFFRILGEQKVSVDHLDAKLREIAGLHLTLLKRAALSVDDDQPVRTLKTEVIGAVGAGDYVRAEQLLRRAFDADLEAARNAEGLATKRYLAAAKTRAELGALKQTQLQYAAALKEYDAALSLVPAGQDVVRAVYLTKVGNTARRLGDFALSERALKEALSIREQMLEPEHDDVASSANNLAFLYGETFRWSEAEPLFRRSLERAKRTGDHKVVVVELNNIASVVGRNGRIDQVESLQRQAVEYATAHLDPDSPILATSLNNLGTLLLMTNRVSEAEKRLRQAIAIYERTNLTDHPDAAMAYGNLAGCLRKDQPEEAEALTRKSLVIRERRLPPNHPEIAVSLNNLGLIMDDLGQPAKAEPLLNRALEMLEGRYGPRDPRVVGIREDLRTVQRKLGK